jgi:hypothetical protein
MVLTVIERHIKVRGAANPCHPDYIEYFEKRRRFAWRTYRVGNVEKEGVSQETTSLVISYPFPIDE